MTKEAVEPLPDADLRALERKFSWRRVVAAAVVSYVAAAVPFAWPGAIQIHRALAPSAPPTVCVGVGFVIMLSLLYDISRARRCDRAHTG